MRIDRTSTGDWQLQAENDDDRAFLDAIHFERTIVPLGVIPSEKQPGGSWHVEGYVLQVNARSPQALRVKAERQALRSLGDLFRLGLRETTQHGHVHTRAPDPQAQETLSAGLVKLEVVTQALGDVVSKAETVVQEMLRAHAASVATCSAIVQIERKDAPQ